MQYIIRHFTRGMTLYNVQGVLPVFLFLVVFLLVSCSSGGNAISPTPTSKYGGNLNVGLNSDAVTLDPLQSTALVDRQVMLNLYDTLVALNAQNTIVPDLATSWSYPTSTELVFTLRTNVTFHTA